MKYTLKKKLKLDRNKTKMNKNVQGIKKTNLKWKY